MNSNIIRLVNFVIGGNLAEARGIFEKTNPGGERDIMKAALYTALWNAKLNPEVKSWISSLPESHGGVQ